MSYSRYMASRAWELLLTFASAISMSMVGFNAFYLRGMGDMLQFIVAFPCVLGLLLALFFAAWDKRHMAVGIVLTVVCAGAIAGGAMSLSTGENPWVDMDGNYLYFAAVVVAATVGCFLLTRTIPGSIIWFVVVVFLCSVIQAMYLMGEYVFSLLAAGTALVLVAYRNARKGALGAQASSGSTATGSFVGSLLPVGSALAAALVLWFAVIAPLGPGTLDIKLLTEYRRLPIVEMRGITNVKPEINTDLKVNELTEGTRYTTDDLVEDANSNVEIPAKDLPEVAQDLAQSQDVEGGGGTSGVHDAPNAENDEESYTPVSYSEIYPWIIFALIVLALIIAAIVAYFVLRRRARMTRLRAMLAGEPREQLSEVYLFCQDRLQRLGFKVPPGSTLAEYARGNAVGMEAFCEEAGVSFEALTSSYVECCAYGKREPSEEEIAQASAFYLGLWAAARTYLGRVKYFFKSFRL